MTVIRPTQIYTFKKKNKYIYIYIYTSKNTYTAHICIYIYTNIYIYKLYTFTSKTYIPPQKNPKKSNTSQNCTIQSCVWHTSFPDFPSVHRRDDGGSREVEGEKLGAAWRLIKKYVVWRFYPGTLEWYPKHPCFGGLTSILTTF